METTQISRIVLQSSQGNQHLLPQTTLTEVYLVWLAERVLKHVPIFCFRVHAPNNLFQLIFTAYNGTRFFKIRSFPWICLRGHNFTIFSILRNFETPDSDSVTKIYSFIHLSKLKNERKPVLANCTPRCNYS